MQSGHYCCFCNTRNCIVPYREKRKNGNVPSLRDWLLKNMKQNTSSWKRIKSWGFYVQRPAGSLGWRDRKKDVLPKGSEGWLESVTQRFPACFGLTMGLRAEIRMGEDLPVHLVSVHPNTGVAFAILKAWHITICIYVCIFFLIKFVLFFQSSWHFQSQEE